MPDPSLDQGVAPEAGWPDRVQSRWAGLPANLRGGLWFLAGALLLSVMLAMIKYAGQRLHVTEILFFRQLVMAAVAAPVIARGFPGALRTARPDLQLARIGLAFGAMTLGFTAVIHLPLAVATTLGFTKTFFMTVLGMALLGEVVRARRWTALMAGFAGVLVVLWPHEAGEFGLYGLASIASAGMVAMVMVLVRKLTRVDRPVTILAWQAIGVGLLMFGPMLFFWRTPTPAEWGLLLAIGLISAAGQFMNILALRAGEASALAPLDFTRLVFAVALGLAVFGEWPEARTFLGAGVIVGAALYTLHRERRAGRARREETAGA